MSSWMCEKCGWEGRTTQKSGHVTYRCTEQGRLKKALEKQARDTTKYLPCVCCGVPVAQVKGLRKKHYLNDEHYEAHRNLQRRQMGRKAKPEDLDEEEANPKPERRLLEEVAPIIARESATEREANAVRIVTGEASFALWGLCLGFNTGDSNIAAM